MSYKKSKVLVYARSATIRELSQNLIKNDFFSKVVVLLEIRDCINLLKSRGNDIDLVVAEYDSSSSRLVEVMNNMHFDKEEKTRKMPYIPLIVLLSDHSHTLDDPVRTIKAAGGCRAVVEASKPLISLVDVMYDAIRQKRNVNDTYADLQEAVQTQKYPFIPIFVKKQNEEEYSIFDESCILEEKNSAGGEEDAEHKKPIILDHVANILNPDRRPLWKTVDPEIQKTVHRKPVEMVNAHSSSLLRNSSSLRRSFVSSASGGGSRHFLDMKELHRTGNLNPQWMGRQSVISVRGTIPELGAVHTHNTATRTVDLPPQPRVAPEELLLHQLIKVDMNSRNTQEKEKEMIEQATSFQAMGLFDRAVAVYNRLGILVGQGPLSKLLLGIMSYEQSQYSNSIVYFTQALSLLKKSNRDSTQSVHDTFLAYYNRGIAYLRLSLFDEGISDLENAVKRKPDNILAQEVFALALRRIGAYPKSIDYTAQAKELRECDEISTETEAHQIAILPSAESRRTTHAADPRGPLSHSSSSRESTKLFVNKGGRRQSGRLEVESHLVKLHPEPNPGLKILALKEEDRVRAVVERAIRMKETLKLFRHKEGLGLDIHEHIFQKPSPLQQALSLPPGKRTKDHVSLIVANIRLIPLLKNLSDDEMAELAGRVEYRVMSTRAQITNQDEPATSVIILLKGSIDMTVDDVAAGQRHLVASLTDSESVYHIDMLFRNEDALVLSAVQDVLRLSDEDMGGISHSTNGRPAGSQTEMITPLLSARSHVERIPVLETPESSSRNEVPSLSSSSVVSRTHPSSAKMLPGELEEASDAINTWEVSDEKEVERPLDHRALQPGIFACASMSSLCELFLFPADLYSRFLYKIALNEFRSRLSVVSACGVFKGLPWQEKVRLARMGRVRYYKEGDTIVKQGEKPAGLFLVMSGVCRALKRENILEVYERSYLELKGKAQRFDTKYAYHHQLKDEVRPAPMTAQRKRYLAYAANPAAYRRAGPSGSTPTTPSATSFDKTPSLSDVNSAVALVGFGWTTHITEAEATRIDLAIEMNKVGSKLRKVRAATAPTRAPVGNNLSKQASFLGQRRSSNVTFLDRPSTANSISDAAESLRDIADETGARAEQDKFCEIGNLTWPMLFGEDAILNPVDGVSRGSVVTDTAAVIFELHTLELQTFKLAADVFERVQIRAIKYPEDKELPKISSDRENWKQFRGEIVRSLKKTRWPKSQGDD